MLESDSDVFEKKSRCFLRGMEKTARGTYSRKNLAKVPCKTEYNLIRPFIEKVDGLSFCQSSLPLRTWLKISSTSQLKCYIAAGDSLIGG